MKVKKCKEIQTVMTDNLDVEKFQQLVTGLLDKGYEPVGGISVTSNGFLASLMGKYEYIDIPD